MLLHLANDEKFIQKSIDFFESIYPGNNKFLIGKYTNDEELKYIEPSEKTYIARYNTKQYKDYFGDFKDYDAIILHYLDDEKIKIIRTAPEEIRFVWMIWGGDAYKLSNIKLFDFETTALLDRLDHNRNYKTLLKQTCLVDTILRIRRKYKRDRIYKAIKKIKYCTTVIPNEYSFIKSFLPLTAIHIPFNYISIDLSLQSRDRNFIGYRDSILVGNSGAPSNNHVSIFKILEKQNLGRRKVIVPLSYGRRDYISEVKKTGTYLFGDSFVPLLDYVPFESYLKTLAGCSVCIMNHYRQQAMGNIMVVLWLGARLYMRSENIAYQYLIENGAIVFPIDGDEISLDPLTEDQKEQNRSVMERLYNHDLIIEKARNLIKIVTSGSNPIN